MKYLVWIIGLFAAAVALAAASHNTAYVLLVYPPYRIELSFILLIILLVGSFMFLYVLVRIINATLNMPAYVLEFRRQRAQVSSRKLLEEVLSAFFEGRYAAAEKAAAHAMELGETSALYPIIAARSANELHEYNKRDAYTSVVEERSVGDATLRLIAHSKFLSNQRNPLEVPDAPQKSGSGK